MTAAITMHHGDALEVLRTMADESVDCCVTSPPYWGLRDYGTAKWEGGDLKCDHKPNMRPGSGRADGIVDQRGQRNRDGIAGIAKARACPCGAVRIDAQLGLERTPEEYVSRMVEIFREVKRVLRGDGTCWINLGDSYASQGGPQVSQTKWPVEGASDTQNGGQSRTVRFNDTIKPKDMVGVPWAVAFALRADGWHLRSDIIWHKPNPMPESVRDRPTKAHEYLFMLAKSERYFYDADAVSEPASYPGDNRAGRNDTRKEVEVMCMDAGSRRRTGNPTGNTRNRRSVWTVPTLPTPEAHFATYPITLIEPCILAGCPAGGTVLDPFMGSGTTGMAALKHGRSFVGIELNAEYIEIAQKRLNDKMPLLAADYA